MGERVWRQLINVYPYSSFDVGEKEMKTKKAISEEQRMARLRANYERDGLLITVGAVLIVEEKGEPCLLLLKRKGSRIAELPGGKLENGEIDVDGVKCKLTNKLAEPGAEQLHWQVMECCGIWYRADFDSEYRSYTSSETAVKECKRIFVVQLAWGTRLRVPSNFELIHVRFSEIECRPHVWGKIISSVPTQPYNYRLNYVH